MNLFRSEEHVKGGSAGGRPARRSGVTRWRARPCVVDRPAPTALAAPHTRAEPGDPRQARAHRAVLAPAVERAACARALPIERRRPAACTPTPRATRTEPRRASRAASQATCDRAPTGLRHDRSAAHAVLTAPGRSRRGRRRPATAWRQLSPPGNGVSSLARRSASRRALGIPFMLP